MLVDLVVVLLAALVLGVAAVVVGVVDMCVLSLEVMATI